MAKALYKPASMSNAETWVDDAKDLIYEHFNEKEKLYAIIRSNDTIYSKSVSYVKFFNYFGNLGGFDKIIKRIKDTENWCPFEIMVNYVAGIGSAHVQIFRHFALQYIP